MKHKMFSLIVGCLAVFVGVGYGLQALGYIGHFTVFFDGWWTVFIIVPAIFSFFQRGSNKMISLAMLLLGVGLLVWRQQWLDVSMTKLILPVIIILFGISMIAGAFTKKTDHLAQCEVIIPEDGSLPQYEASFGTVNPNYNGQKFEGCRMDVSFGEGVLDLRQAIIEKDCTVQAEVAFGKGELLLPVGCRLDLKTNSAFGGVENKYLSSDDPTAHTLHVEANVNFGALEIK